MEHSERRKRKIGKEEDEDDDVSEEEKVDKFFALIRSTREIRDRLRNVPIDGPKEKNKPEDTRTAIAEWKPTFRPEDFKDPRSVAVNDIAGPSAKTEEEKQQEQNPNEGGAGEDIGLDLKLSL